MTVVEVSQARPSTRSIRNALVVSLSLHVLCFGAWKWGQATGFWQRISAPHWLEAFTKKVLSPIEIKIPVQTQARQAVPLIFVDTDPSHATTEPPKNPKFYSAQNTEASNPKIVKESDLPDITGHQEHVLKATDSGKSVPKPLQPSPKPDEAQQKLTAQEAKARQNVKVGDLAMVKPRDVAKPDDGKSETSTSAAPEAQPEHRRPRTIEEALQQRGMAGARMRQSGGAPRITADSSFAAMGTSYGDYDREFIDAVDQRWRQLLQTHTASGVGRVVVDFYLLPTGRITDLKVVENTADDLSGIVCSSAITDPAPYRPWPRQMQLDLGADRREIRFTFYYDSD